ncbi:MAG: N-acetylneuraminate synthase [Cyclobacteriaceae bacterium]|nr:N-acetylneuraminate synthase [Cyclobacteriaceae bacterium HetDA_MAG_MS6]
MEPTYIIAEAGVNHNGNAKIAKQLVDAAVDAGANFIKFQTFRAESLVTRQTSVADYQKKHLQCEVDQSQYTMLKRLELDINNHREIIRYCIERGIGFLSTPFDIESIDLLENLGISMFKVPSGEVTNLPYLERVASMDKPVILSTGMCLMEEVEMALEILTSASLDKKDITILHCNTEYPTPYQDVNLGAMVTIQRHLGVKVGYSDHTLGIEIPIAAVALGAVVIEKHITLDRNMNGPDHASSLEPLEFKQMVQSVRNIEVALGDGVKRPSPSESANILFARKSIHILKGMRKGQQIKRNDLIMKRPGDGISPMKLYQVVGKRVKKDLVADHKLGWGDLIS